jgi:proteasome lid subunit RPN8/RPN11
MLHALVHFARQLLSELSRRFAGPRVSVPQIQELFLRPVPDYRPLQRVVLTDEVGRTLFEEYEAHRAGARREEETGWVLLGIREAEEAVVMATLPAGTQRDAGVGHVQFNSMGQALGSRIVRQLDRRLTILGVVHTHPGSLRHPSDADFQGDRNWVGQLRGKEGIFGIGTVEKASTNGMPVAQQPRPNVHCLGRLRFTWYVLGEGERNYRPLPLGLTLGPDLARSLHSVWAVIEAHADRLDRLCRQQTGISFRVAAGENGPVLSVKIPLAEPEHAIEVCLEEKAVRYFLHRKGEVFLVEPGDARIDRAVYLLLAELAAKSEGL